MRVVLDTNVIISAVIASGTSRELLNAWRFQSRYSLITCPLLLTELEEVLARPRFNRWIRPDEREALVALLRTESEFVDDPAEIPRLTDDPDDDYLVALAIRERADLLVSGDRHLTSMREPPIPIVSPAEALAIVLR